MTYLLVVRGAMDDIPVACGSTARPLKRLAHNPAQLRERFELALASVGMSGDVSVVFSVCLYQMARRGLVSSEEVLDEAATNAALFPKERSK